MTGRPVHVLAAVAVLLTAAAIAVAQSFGLQAAGPAPTVAAPTAATRTTSAPAAQRAAAAAGRRRNRPPSSGSQPPT